MKSINVNALKYSHTDIMYDSKFIVFDMETKITHNGIDLVYPALYVNFDNGNMINDTHIHCTETDIDIYLTLDNQNEILELCKEYLMRME